MNKVRPDMETTDKYLYTIINRVSFGNYLS